MDEMTTTTRCKFVCQSVTKKRPWNAQPGAKEFLYEASFSAVSDGSEENRAFFDATPCGELKIGTYKEDRFEVGRTYYIDLSLAAE